MRIATLILALLSLLMGCGGNGSSHANKSDSPSSSSGGADAESVAILSEVEAVFDEYRQMTPKPAIGDKFFEKRERFSGKRVTINGVIFEIAGKDVYIHVGNIKAWFKTSQPLTIGTTVRVYGKICGEDYAGRTVTIDVERIEVPPKN